MHRQAIPAATSPLPHRIRSALLTAACSDIIAASLAGIVLPTTVQLDVAMNEASSHGHTASPALRQLWILAQHLTERQGQFDEDGFAAKLAADPKAVSHGATTAVLHDPTLAPRWRDIASRLHQGQGSYGSTAAVRALAAGLLPASLDTIAGIARRSAAITHTHPVALASAAVVACGVALALQGKPDAAITADRFLAIIGSYGPQPELSHHLSVVRTLIRHRAGPAETTATLARDGSALHAVPAALTAFLRHDRDPMAAIRYAAAIGGGNTRAALLITATLAGARNPSFQPAPHWRPAMDPIRIHTLAGSLAAVGHQPGTRAHP